ncbi:uncharacterized protein LOC142776796 [Rhipicephalus microplus]|uniref:uncharacterized protein LOC142776796 n=1 Tax=Rhipicephalus microplus TaxID=6941 RepID=UPI003F6BBB2D
MAPTEYRCPICQEASKSFRSLLHHVQWWHGFCRDGPVTQQPRCEEESIPNYDLVRKRDAYLREQGKLRAKVDKFFHCAELGMKFNHRTEKPRFRCREGPPPAVVYEEFWPHTTSEVAPDPGYTAVNPRDVGSHNKSGVTERATEASTYESSEPFATTEAAKNAVDYVNHRAQVKAATRATQTNPRPTRHAEKHRVTFAPDDSAMVQPEPPRRPPRCTRRVEKFLESIIKYLSMEDLLVCRQVCRAWKRIIERPQHWLHIDLKHTTISAQIFTEMASWCSAVQSISLEALEVAFGDLNQEPMNSRVHLEHGLENLLRACCKTLKVLTIIGCDNVLTDRQVFFVFVPCFHFEAPGVSECKKLLGKRVCLCTQDSLAGECVPIPGSCGLRNSFSRDPSRSAVVPGSRMQACQDAHCATPRPTKEARICWSQSLPDAGKVLA